VRVASLSPVRALSSDDVRRLVSPDEVMECQRDAFVALASGEAQLAPRAVLAGEDGSAAFAYLARAGRGLPPVVKLGSVNPLNAARGLPGIHALVLVMDADTGELAWSIDGESVTLLRTAAATAVAVRALAPDARAIAIVGSGPQAVEHAAFLRHALPSHRLTVHARRPERAASLREELDRRGLEAAVVGDARLAVEGSDVVIAATNSVTPVVLPEWLDATGLLVSIGSFAPGRCEVDATTLAGFDQVVVDDVATAAAQCGPVVDAIESGALLPDGLVSLGDVLSTGESRPRGERWAYLSVGLGVQDAALAALLVSRAG